MAPDRVIPVRVGNVLLPALTCLALAVPLILAEAVVLSSFPVPSLWDQATGRLAWLAGSGAAVLVAVITSLVLLTVKRRGLAVCVAVPGHSGAALAVHRIGGIRAVEIETVPNDG